MNVSNGDNQNMSNIYRVSEKAVINKKTSHDFDEFCSVNMIKRTYTLAEYLHIFSMPQKEKDKIEKELTDKQELYMVIGKDFNCK